MDPLFARLRRLAVDRDPDGRLLARSAAGDEEAFAELLRRHGPTVWAAARRQLPDPADAADVFQATFLVLLQKRGRLGGAPAVGPWLYRVAALTARNLRRKNARRLARRRPLLDVAVEPVGDLRADLDDALLTLPERDRAAVVLCHLHGYSRREAAELLGLPEGTLSSVLSRALARLRTKLGDDPLPLLAVGTLTVPAGVATAATQAAAAVRVASLAAAGAEVASLTREALRMFWLKKLAAGGMAVAACLGLGVGVGLAPRSAAVAAEPPKPPAAKWDEHLKPMGRVSIHVRAGAPETGNTPSMVWSEYDSRVAEDGRELPFIDGNIRDPHALWRLLDRVRRDVDVSRRQVALKVDAAVPPEFILKVAGAITQAGYPSVYYTGPLPMVATVDGKPKADWKRAIQVANRQLMLAGTILYTEPPRCIVYTAGGAGAGQHVADLTGEDTVPAVVRRAGVERLLAVEEVKVLLTPGGRGEVVPLDRVVKPGGSVVYLDPRTAAAGDVILQPGDSVMIVTPQR